MPAALRLGIFGSCVSRDMAHEHPDCSVVFYVARQSLLSATSAPHPAAQDLPLDLESPFQIRMVRGDLSSDLMSVLASHADEVDALVIDLVDERLGVVAMASGGYATNSQEFKQSGVRKLVAGGTDTVLELGEPDHLSAWAAAADTFVDGLEQLGLAHRSVVLRTDFATLTVDGQPVAPYMNIPASAWNDSFRAYVEVLRRRGITVLDLPSELAAADPDHRWGVSPYHYRPEAYAWLMRELRSALALDGSADVTADSSRVRVPLSLPVSRVNGPPTRGAVRLRMSTAAAPTKWRLRISNVNDRTLRPGRGAVELSGLWLGHEGTGGAFRSPPERLMPRFPVSSGGAFATPWFNAPIGDGQPWLLAFGWSAGGADLPVFSLADSYQWADPDDAASTVEPHLRRRRYVPLAWCLEVEVGSETPVVAAWGDERTLSTREAAALSDSVLSRWARSHHALAVHVVFPGTSLAQWAGYSQQWDRVRLRTSDCTVFHLQGGHDLEQGATVEQLCARFAETLPSVRRALGDRVVAVLLDQTRPLDAHQQSVRDTYNAWLTDTFDGAVVTLTDGEFVMVRPPLGGGTTPSRRRLGDTTQ